MTDLVDRITAAVQNKGLDIGSALELLNEAADEIERLRAAVLALSSGDITPIPDEQQELKKDDSFWSFVRNIGR